MELPELIERSRGFVVQLAYTITGLPLDRLQKLRAHGPVWSVPFGTGFVANEAGWVVTAKHVVDDLVAFPSDVPEGDHIVGVGFAHSGQRPGTFRVIKFDVVAVDPRNDIALLKLRSNPFGMSDEKRRSETGDLFSPSVASFAINRPVDGAGVAVMGYPLGEPVLVTTSGHVASAWAVDIQDGLRSDGHGGYLPANVAERYLTDVQTDPGNSGGPAVLLSDGAVIGMHVASRLTNPGSPDSAKADLGVVIPSATILRFAAEHGVALPTAAS